MNINSINTTNTNIENKTPNVNKAKATEKVESENQNKKTPETKKISIEATKNEDTLKTYNASGKLNDNAMVYAQSTQVQTQIQPQPQSEKVVSNKSNTTSTQKVQAVSKSIDTRA